MKLGIPVGVGSPLGKRLAWLTFLRLVVLAAFLGIIELYYNRELPFGGFSSAVAMITVGSAFLLSAAYTVLLRGGRRLTTVAYAQLATDQLTWTAIAYVSGGVTSGSTSLYGLTCLYGALLLGTRGAITAALAGMSTYLLLCGAFVLGVLPPPTDQAPGAYVIELNAMVYPAFSTLMATALAGALSAALSERLRAFGGELEAAKERADRAERLAMLGRLSAALAHEIRNPLSSIRGSIELLRTGSSVSEEDKKLCHIIEREAARLNDLVTDMVHLSRARAPALAAVDLANTAQGVVELARGGPRGDEVTISYAGPDELVIQADAAQMRQVLWNLVRNAMQASEADQDVSVELARASDGGAAMSVRDSGSGIPDSKRAEIFDAFYTTRSHGVGIGLAVVKQIADAHAFELEVESKQEEGTTVSLRIPKASVLASVALVGMLAIGCGGGRDWVEAPNNAPDVEEDGMFWADAKPRAAAARTASPARSADPSPPASGQADAGAAQPVAIETYRNTYYDFPSERAAGRGKTTQLFDASCNPIQMVSQVFHDQLCVQGSGRLVTGETVSFAKRNCDCARICPRTDQKICFEKLDRQAFPFGRGASGKAITPLKSVAVDSTVIPLGTVLYIPDYQGLRGPDGQPHDGCFIAEDRGLKVKGRHIDVFTGNPDVTKSWNRAVPTGDGVRVIVGASRCQHLSRK